MSNSATPRTVDHQAPLSKEISRQEYWSGLPSPPPGNLPNPGIEPTFPVCPAWQADNFTTEPPGKTGEENKTFKRSFLLEQISLTVGAIICVGVNYFMLLLCI